MRNRRQYDAFGELCPWSGEFLRTSAGGGKPACGMQSADVGEPCRGSACDLGIV